jgi:aminoglycoside N3'-acetyltransferase
MSFIEQIKSRYSRRITDNKQEYSQLLHSADPDNPNQSDVERLEQLMIELFKDAETVQNDLSIIQRAKDLQPEAAKVDELHSAMKESGRALEAARQDREKLILRQNIRLNDADAAKRKAMYQWVQSIDAKKELDKLKQDNSDLFPAV